MATKYVNRQRVEMTRSFCVPRLDFRVYDGARAHELQSMSELLDVRGLTVDLPTARGWVCPVNEVTLRIGAGESLGLVGESGSGKTLMALSLMGLLPPGARVSGEAILSSANSAPENLAELDE